MKSTCENCTDRHEACWSTCEKYIKARDEYRNAQAQLRNSPADDFLAENVAKMKRRKNRK